MSERLDALRERASGVRTRVGEVVTVARIARVFVTLALLAVPVGVLYISWTLAGPLATVVYGFVFLLTFALIPLLITIMGAATPGGGSLGKAHFIAGQVAAGHGYLVQTMDGYELCVGDDGGFYLDGEYHEIEAGDEHRTILGWQPFGLAWVKDSAALDTERVDGEPVSDGGEHAVERAGIPEVPPPASMDTIQECPDCGTTYPNDDRFECDCGSILIKQDSETETWIVDLKRLYRSGLQRIGNVDLLETTEEQTMQDEVDTGKVSEWATVIGAMIGLVIGVGAGYVALFV